MTMIFVRFLSRSHSLAGMILAAFSFALLTLVDTLFKIVATGHPTYQILVTNGCFALIPILIWTFYTGGLKRLHTTRLAQHLLRGSISVASAFAAVYAYSRLPLTDFYAIVFAGPLLVTTMSSIFLGEMIGRRRWIAIFAGFLGVLVVTNPLQHLGEQVAMPDRELLFGQIAAFVSVFCYSLSVIMIRHMRTGETNLTFSLYGYIASITISSCLWLFHLQDAPPSMGLMDVGHLALSGLLAGTASICLMTAYHRTPVSLVAPFQYTQIIWAAIVGYFLWSSFPDINLVVGAILVAASGLFVIYSEVRPKVVSP